VGYALTGRPGCSARHTTGGAPGATGPTNQKENRMPCTSCVNGVMTVTVIDNGESSTEEQPCWDCHGTGQR
jgi:hypothetical protein